MIRFILEFVTSHLSLFQWLVGYHVLLQLQYFDCADHVGPYNHVHSSGLTVLHCPH